MSVPPHPLAPYGWTADRDADVAGETDLVPARVALQERGAYLLYGSGGEIAAQVSGRFRHDARRTSDYPVAGD